MTSTKERQRAAARARLEREMAQRAESARKRRRMQATIGAGVALVIVVVGTVWLVSALGDDDSATTGEAAAGTATCTWIEVAQNERTATTKDVGLPPTTASKTGTKTMTVTTNFGAINVTLDQAKSPCAAASFEHLASKKFFDGTKCHRMFPGMLQCGDPSAKGKGYRETDGTGGPSYRFGNEYLPTTDKPAYPAGVVALANSGSPDSNGSQFFFIYQDAQLSPDYTVIGTVDQAGLGVLTKATEKGHDGAFDPNPGGGHPKNDIEMTTVTVS
ncbi:peptidylprolyl isomerase [Actinomycetes bacterium KLBMP 9797]